MSRTPHASGFRLVDFTSKSAGNRTYTMRADNALYGGTFVGKLAGRTPGGSKIYTGTFTVLRTKNEVGFLTLIVDRRNGRVVAENIPPQGASPEVKEVTQDKAVAYAQGTDHFGGDAADASKDWLTHKTTRVYLIASP